MNIERRKWKEEITSIYTLNAKLNMLGAGYIIEPWSLQVRTNKDILDKKYIEIVEPARYIGQTSFFQNNNVQAIKLPSTMRSIADGAFYGCARIQDVELNEGLKDIGYRCFCRCTEIRKIKLPSTLVSIGDGAFSGCNKLEEIEIPSGVAEISQSMFQGCTELNTVILNEGIKAIGNYAFYDCVSLKRIVFPKTLDVISPLAFSKCSNLKEVIFKNKNIVHQLSGIAHQTVLPIPPLPIPIIKYEV